MWVCGVLCGPYSVENPSGYELDGTARSGILSQLVGCVVNVDHFSVEAAVATSLYCDGVVTGRGVRSVLPHVGVVRDAWLLPDGTLWVLFYVDDDCTGVCGLLESGHLGCLSLTHYNDGRGAFVPVEVALCSAPARPFCYVRHAGWSLPAACEYKARVLRGVIPSIPVMETSPATSKLEAILSALSDADRGLVEARFTEMMGAVDDATQAKKEAEKTLEHLRALKETDKKLLKQHFDTLTGLLSPELKEQFLVNSDMHGILSTAEPDVVHNVSNLIKCASASMMSLASESSGPSSKRSRVEVEETVSEAVPVSSSSSSGGSVLSRALANTFNAV